MGRQNIAEGENRLPSGNWCGYFVDPHHGLGHDADHKWNMDIVMSFRCDGTFVGFGEDEIATFYLKIGKIIGDEVRFIKAYKTHRIQYKGNIIGNQIMGIWSFDDWNIGKWCGYFVDPRHGLGHDADHRWNMDIVMSFRCDGTFVAFGVDEVGTFELKNGKITGDEVRFIKAYKTHRIQYKGNIIGNQITGEWSFHDWDIGGQFTLYPDAACQ